MITKEELKKEVDKLPESLLNEVYTLFKRIILQKKAGINSEISLNNSWKEWKNSLEKFTPDFMNSRGQSSNQTRESFDS